MTTQELLKKLGLDDSSPVETLLEQLEEKNLEYLERTDACGDKARAAELRSTQEQIEAAIQELRGGVSLQRAPAEPEGGPAPAPVPPASPSPKAAPSPAPKAPPSPAPKAPPSPKAQAQRTQRELFDAAQAGDGAAALELAKLYDDDGNYESALKWVKTAHSLKTPGAGKCLIALYGRAGNKNELVSLCVEELGWLTGYDQFELCENLVALFEKKDFSPHLAAQAAKDILAILPADSAARDLVEEARQKAEKDIAAQQQQAEQHRKDQEAREQAKKAALEQAEKQRKEQQRKQAQEKAKQSRQLFWQKVFPKLFCFFAPPLLAWGVHSLFWFLAQNEHVTEARGWLSLFFVILVLLPPLLAGALCFYVPNRSNRLRYKDTPSILISLVNSATTNLACFIVLALIGKIFEGVLKSAFPITLLGPLKLTAQNYYAYGTAVAFYILAIGGDKDILLS